MGPEKKPSPYVSFGSKLGNTLHTKIRLNASDLNSHRFSIGLLHEPKCPCCHNKEDNDHYLLRCRLYADDRDKHSYTLTAVLGYDCTIVSRHLTNFISCSTDHEAVKIHPEMSRVHSSTFCSGQKGSSDKLFPLGVTCQSYSLGFGSVMACVARGCAVSTISQSCRQC